MATLLISLIFLSLTIGPQCRLGCASLLAPSPQLVDSNKDQLDIEAIAQAVCGTQNGSSKQISRISTIGRLAAYLEELPDQHKLAKCRDQYLESVFNLRDLVAFSNQNVCSDEKIAAIGNFHQRYVSTAREEDSPERVGRSQAPRILKLFFMHYAVEVSTICKRTLIHNLEWDLEDKVSAKDFELVNAESLEKLVRLGNFFTSKEGYEDVVLVWDLIDESYFAYMNPKLQDLGYESVDQITGEPIKLLLKVRQASQWWTIQHLCRKKFRPIYSKLILPVVRLANMGYSCTGEQFARELAEHKQSKLVSQWYTMTQICEALLPIQFFQHDSVGADQVAIITKEEASLLRYLQNKEGLPPRELGANFERVEYEPSTNSMVGVDKLESVETSEAQHFVSKINSNLSARDRAMKRAVKRILSTLKTLLKAKTSKIFLSRKIAQQPSGQTLAEAKAEAGAGAGAGAETSSAATSGDFEMEDIQQVFSKSLEGLSESEMLKLEGAAPRHIERARRRRRPGDIDGEKANRANAISYRRTKSWSEIFAGWRESLSILAPNRLTLLICGSIVIFLLFMVIFIIGFHLLLPTIASGMLAGK